MSIAPEQPTTFSPASEPPISRGRSVWLSKATAAVLAAAALLVYPLVMTSSFAQNIGILALTMAIAATGWNILGGYAGQVSFGHAVFFATGMYGTALLVRAGWSPWPAMPVVAATAAVLAILIGLPTFRLRGHYFSIATLAIGSLALTVLPNIGVLGGGDGLTVPLEPYGLWNLQFSLRDKAPYYYAALGLFLVVAVLSQVLLRGRAGRYLRAIRDDELAAAAIGVPVRRYKLFAGAGSAAVTSVAGAFQVMVVLFVDPSSSLDFSISTAIALIAVVGGIGSPWGPLLGAWLVTALQESTRTYLSATGRTIDLMLFGALIIAVTILDPLGLTNIIKRARRLLISSRRPIREPSRTSTANGKLP